LPPKAGVATAGFALKKGIFGHSPFSLLGSNLDSADARALSED